MISFKVWICLKLPSDALKSTIDVLLVSLGESKAASNSCRRPWRDGITRAKPEAKLGI